MLEKQPVTTRGWNLKNRIDKNLTLIVKYGEYWNGEDLKEWIKKTIRYAEYKI